MSGELGNADTLANQLLTSLTTGTTFAIPDIDMSTADYTLPALSVDLTTLPARPTNDNLTTKLASGGTGTFDIVIDSIINKLKAQYDAGRINGDQFSTMVSGAMEPALAQSVQFLLNKDQAYWTGVAAQYQAWIAQAQYYKAKVELNTAKAQFEAVRIEAMNQQATFALTKLRLSTESAQYLAADYTANTMLPAQKNQVDSQKALVDSQKLGQDKQNSILDYQLTYLMPIQKLLTQEQAEQVRAQTMDTRTDGATAVVGVMGKQKDLYAQQITSYKRDAEYKFLKILSDTWTAQKTIDEGLTPPTEFDNNSINSVVQQTKTNLGLTDAT